MATDPHRHPDERVPEREREVIVTNGGGRSGMSGAIVAVLAIIVIALIAWLVLSILGGADGDVDEPAVEVPTEVDVNVDEGGG